MGTDSREFYKACNLKNNPFRPNPTFETDPRMRIWVGYEKEKTVLEKFLVRTRSDHIGNENFLLLYGDYGTGKSHALLWARHQILQTRKEEFQSVAYYIQTLKRGGGKLSFAEAFKEDILAKSNLTSDILNYKNFLEGCILQFKHEQGHPPEVSKETVLKQLLGALELYNFAIEILNCNNNNEIEQLIGPPKQSDHDAMMTLTKLVNLFTYEVRLADGSRRFKKAAYLFVDELDLLAYCSAKEAREVNDLVRHIYDLCPNCFCMILSFTATAAEITTLFDVYVLSRVSRQIRMDLLEIDDAKKFVKDILDTERDSSSGRMGYFPFEESAIEHIVSQIVSITPRKIVNVMQQILEEVRLIGQDPSSEPISLDLLEGSGILDEVFGGE
jgi:hypothetical protein